MADIDTAVYELANTLTKLHANSNINDVRQIHGKGEVNQVYELSTNTSKYVLRINSLIEYERFKKENWCYESSSKIGLKVPKVITYGTDNDYSYILLEYIQGLNGNAIVSNRDLWSNLGKQLRLIHSIPVHGFGESLNSIVNGNAQEWEHYLQANITSLKNQSLITKLGINQSTSQKLQQLFNDLLIKRFTFGLNHGDFSLKNIILQDSIPYIIDWGSAEAHIVPHHDLAVILDESLEEESVEYASLLSGYGMVRADYEVIKKEIITLQLLEAIDKFRWALDNSANQIEHYSRQVEKFVQKVELQLR